MATAAWQIGNMSLRRIVKGAVNHVTIQVLFTGFFSFFLSVAVTRNLFIDIHGKENFQYGFSEIRPEERE